MIIENISINGIKYTFETKNNKTELVYLLEVTDSNINDEVTIKIPNILVITRNTGEILFILECGGNDKFEMMTVKELYAKKIQWFEPLADNYRKLLFVNKKDYVKAAYKIFSWQDIYDFSVIDRMPMAYLSNKSGDWKTVENGADGYIISLINDIPYWSDAIGQIPYAIDTFRMMRNRKSVQYWGGVFAEGSTIAAIKAIITGDLDKTTTWDNFFILRGVIFAENKFKYEVLPSKDVYPKAYVREIITSYDYNKLGLEITKTQKEKYL